MRKLVINLFAFFSCVCSFAQNVQKDSPKEPVVTFEDDSIMIRQIADEILSHSKAYDNLHDLTKNIGGRLSGSAGFYKAEQWGLKILQQSGADKAWLQECMIPHWVRGGEDEAISNIASQKKNLDVIALGNSKGTGPKGVQASVVEVTSFEL